MCLGMSFKMSLISLIHRASYTDREMQTFVYSSQPAHWRLNHSDQKEIRTKFNEIQLVRMLQIPLVDDISHKSSDCSSTFLRCSIRRIRPTGRLVCHSHHPHEFVSSLYEHWISFEELCKCHSRVSTGCLIAARRLTLGAGYSRFFPTTFCRSG